MQTIHNKNQNRKCGFTLVELIVSLGLFTVVVMIAMGALLSLANTNRKVRTMHIAMDNINLVLESMSREIRMGSVYTCNPALPTNLIYGGVGVDCLVLSGGGSSMAFLAQSGSNNFVYRNHFGIIQRSEDGGNNWSNMTAPNIDITDFKFYVIGAGSSKKQPHIIISITGKVGGNGKLSSSFRIQTTVTQILPK